MTSNGLISLKTDCYKKILKSFNDHKKKKKKRKKGKIKRRIKIGIEAY